MSLAANAPLAAPAARPAPASVRLPDFAALVALAGDKRDMRLKVALESEVRLARFEPGRIEFELAPGASPALAQTLTQKLQEWTGDRWIVAIVKSGGAPTLAERREAQERERRSGLEADPLVASVLARFPGAQIVAVRGKEPDGRAAPEIDYDEPAEADED